MTTNKNSQNKTKYFPKLKIFFDVCEEDSISNAYTVQCLWFFIAVLTVFITLQIFHIHIVDNHIAMPGLIGSALILLVAEVFGIFVEHTRPWLKYVLILLSVISVTIAGIFLTYHSVLTSFVPLLIAAQYLQKSVIRFAYIMTIISVFVIVFLGYKYGLCDANMIIQTVSKTSSYGGHLSYDILPLSERWPSLIFYFAVPRCLIITAFVPMINAIVRNRKEIILRNLKSKYIGEHDFMTGFYNRSKYESMLNECYRKLERVAIIFFDLNNLKHINDTYGHDKGDELIKRAATSIKCALSDNMDAYRLGGDEFIIVIPNGYAKDAESFIENWKKKLEIVNSHLDDLDCQIAYGYATGEGNAFTDLLKLADRNMYSNKKSSKA